MDFEEMIERLVEETQPAVYYTNNVIVGKDPAGSIFIGCAQTHVFKPEKKRNVPDFFVVMSMMRAKILIQQLQMAVKRWEEENGVIKIKHGAIKPIGEVSKEP